MGTQKRTSTSHRTVAEPPTDRATSPQPSTSGAGGAAQGAKGTRTAGASKARSAPQSPTQGSEGPRTAGARTSTAGQTAEATAANTLAPTGTQSGLQLRLEQVRQMQREASAQTRVEQVREMQRLATSSIQYANENILGSRPQTRSRGPAPDLPLTMDKPKRTRK